MDLLHSAIIRALPLVPRSVLRRVAGRYIAGESRQGLLAVVDRLHGQGLLTTVDVLGENIAAEGEARAAAAEYRQLIRELSGRGPSPQVSVKLSLLGLRFDERLAESLLFEITGEAAAAHVGVYLDMEDTTTTDATLRLYRNAHGSVPRLGIAIQAYLKRSLRDVLDLLPLRPAIRICKGIYNESPDLALKDRAAIRESYLSILRAVIDGDGYPAIATHDSWLVDRALEHVRAARVERDSHEFQMLLGVGEGLWRKIRASGAALRLYCPYGPDWLAYSLRRLKENPHMAGYIMKSVFNRKILERGNLGR